MTLTQAPKIVRTAVWLSPVVLVMGAFFAAIPWLKTLEDWVVLAVGSAAAIFVMSYAVYASIRCQRGLDEVQKAGARFGGQWGVLAGSIAFVLLMVLPPFHEFLTGVVDRFASDPGTSADPTVVAFSAMLGFMAAVVLQSLGTLVASAMWWTGKR
jgi:hypothetical protein